MPRMLFGHALQARLVPPGTYTIRPSKRCCRALSPTYRISQKWPIIAKIIVIVDDLAAGHTVKSVAKVKLFH